MVPQGNASRSLDSNQRRVSDNLLQRLVQESDSHETRANEDRRKINQGRSAECRNLLHSIVKCRCGIGISSASIRILSVPCLQTFDRLRGWLSRTLEVTSPPRRFCGIIRINGGFPAFRLRAEILLAGISMNGKGVAAVPLPPWLFLSSHWKIRRLEVGKGQMKSDHEVRHEIKVQQKTQKILILCVPEANVSGFIVLPT